MDVGRGAPDSSDLKSLKMSRDGALRAAAGQSESVAEREERPKEDGP
jgi:hypothetical protein